jgi:hypothetical protein
MPVEMITGRIQAVIIGKLELAPKRGTDRGKATRTEQGFNPRFVKLCMEGHALAQVRPERKSQKTEKNCSGALILLRLNT